MKTKRDPLSKFYPPYARRVPRAAYVGQGMPPIPDVPPGTPFPGGGAPQAPAPGGGIFVPPGSIGGAAPEPNTGLLIILGTIAAAAVYFMATGKVKAA